MPNVKNPLVRAYRHRRDRQPFDDAERKRFENHPVHEGAGVALVAVADDVLRFARLLRDDAPLLSRWESRPAASAQTGFLDGGDDFVRRSSRREEALTDLEFVRTLALTLTLSPGEREQLSSALIGSYATRIDSVTRIFKSRRTILPLLEERAGVRASVQLTSQTFCQRLEPFMRQIFIQIERVNLPEMLRSDMHLLVEKRPNRRVAFAH